MLERDKQCVVVSAGRLGSGGVLTHLRLLCLELCRKGIQVLVFGSGSDWPQQKLDELQNGGAQIVLPPRILWRYPRLSNFYSALTWPWLMPRKTVSLYCVGAGRSHAYLRRLCGRETVSIYHEIVSPPSRESLAGRCIALLDVSIANSEGVAQIVRDICPGKPVRVIPFLTAGAVMRPPKHRPPANGQELRILYLGRLVRHKRPDQLVKNWSMISSLKPISPARLDIYGNDSTGQMLPELRELVSQTGLSHSIAVHGAYDSSNLREILDNADIVVLPSLWEGLPLVLVEAMQHGVPVVACNAGGIAELGENNPDVIITSTEWQDFVEGVREMAGKIRSGQIDNSRLFRWTEKRYGFSAVSNRWLAALLTPLQFFDFQP
jgi:glycosyltransferase involved in cell wall biosynthesis